MVTKLTDSKEDAKPENADSMSDEQKEYDISRSLKLTGQCIACFATRATGRDRIRYPHAGNERFRNA